MAQTLQSSQTAGLNGQITVPGDKSISHRALIIASQVLGQTTISGLLEGEDVLNTAEAMRTLGVNVIKLDNGTWKVSGVGVGGLAEPEDVLDMGNSGTSTRLIMGLVSPYPFTTIFTGDASLRSRPMARVSNPLEQIGVRIAARDGTRLPLALTGTATPMPITYTLPVASAQVKSAILLAGLNTPGITTVIEPEATRDHTENMLKHFGFSISRKDNAISIKGQQELPHQDREITVPADPSSAAFLTVAALITPKSSPIIKNVCINPLRTGLYTVLKQMGAQIIYKNERMVAGEKVADIEVKSSKLKAVEVPAHLAPSMIDEYPILAVAAAFAEGTTVMHGLAELRIKESDRLTAIAEGLKACGVTTVIESDTLKVTGGTVKGGASIAAKLDHRIAMSFLVLGMASEQPVTIDDGSTINTSFPGFVELVNKAGGHITPIPATAQFQPLVIAIDGPAASGKGTLARRLAEELGYSYLDTGSLYRAVGLKLIYSGKDPADKKAAIAAAHAIDDQDLANPRLRQERIGQAASIVSAIPEVRAALLEYQRNFAKRPEGAVLDGRDIGTVVCPDADLKIFITASLEARAKRRHRELQGEGVEVVYNSVLEDLRKRDERDSQRAAAPLVAAEDAVIIDTSEMDAKAVYEKVHGIVGKKLAQTP